MIILTRTRRLALMRDGQHAYRDGKPSSECPYDLDSGDDRQAAQAAAWIRGYAVTRNIDTEASGRPFYEA